MILDKLLAVLREHELLKSTQALEGIASIPGGLVTDSREIAAGDIFVCIKGFTSDGHAFIPIARERNAALIVCEDGFVDALPAIRVTDCRKAAALIAGIQYDHPSTKFRLVGVTGTNGKTSTSLVQFHAMRHLGYKAGWIGTLGYYINDKHYTTGHTTPDILELNRILDSMAREGVSHVFMEVSSHAIALDRIYGLEYDICLFTNLTREHLDFHKDMESYGETKYRFFSRVAQKLAVGLVNIDDQFGSTIHTRLREADGHVFSIGTAPADYHIDAIDLAWEGCRFALSSPEGILDIHSGLVGRFNVSNLAMATATLSLLGMDKRQIEEGIASVLPVPGRMQSIPNARGIGLFVDYAHTPDALDNVLKTARELPHNRILCLIGAGGDRDHGKRPLMLTAALRNSDAVIISDDNPRCENPNSIVLDIISDAHPNLPWWIIRDRELAIRSLIKLARPGDVVMICGKGHETYQEIMGVRHPFDDAGIARTAISEDSRPDEGMALPLDRLMLQVICGAAPEKFPAGYQAPCTYHYVSTDSRTIREGSVFFALRGEKFDGHAFLGNVLASDTNHAVGEIALPEHDHYTRAESSLECYRLLCKRYLQMFAIYKVAITGSTGKTSTKELLDLVCRQMAPTLKTTANENNIIGLCQTILRIDPSHEYAVFEIGTNHFGEIALLADTCAPDAGIIVNIGPSHLEAFGDESGVYQEKSTLFKRPLDIRLYDGDDARFGEFAASGYGIGYSEAARYRITDVTVKEKSTAFSLNGHFFEIPYVVRHMVVNAAFAIAFGLQRNFPAAEIQSALSGPLSMGYRMKEADSRYGRLILDCYNANPLSMQNAIEHWLGVDARQPHVAILGDMLELGGMASHYHSMIGAILAEKQYDMLITVGDLSRLYRPMDESVSGRHYATVADAITGLETLGLPEGAVILVKASHGIHLEQIAEYLQKD